MSLLISRYLPPTQPQSPVESEDSHASFYKERTSRKIREYLKQLKLDYTVSDKEKEVQKIFVTRCSLEKLGHIQDFIAEQKFFKYFPSLEFVSAENHPLTINISPNKPVLCYEESLVEVAKGTSDPLAFLFEQKKLWRNTFYLEEVLHYISQQALQCDSALNFLIQLVKVDIKQSVYYSFSIYKEIIETLETVLKDPQKSFTASNLSKAKEILANIMQLLFEKRGHWQKRSESDEATAYFCMRALQKESNLQFLLTLLKNDMQHTLTYSFSIYKQVIETLETALKNPQESFTASSLLEVQKVLADIQQAVPNQKAQWQKQPDFNEAIHYFCTRALKQESELRLLINFLKDGISIPETFDYPFPIYKQVIETLEKVLKNPGSLNLHAKVELEVEQLIEKSNRIIFSQKDQWRNSPHLEEIITAFCNRAATRESILKFLLSFLTENIKEPFSYPYFVYKAIIQSLGKILKTPPVFFNALLFSEIKKTLMTVVSLGPETPKVYDSLRLKALKFLGVAISHDPEIKNYFEELIKKTTDIRIWLQAFNCLHQLERLHQQLKQEIIKKCLDFMMVENVESCSLDALALDYILWNKRTDSTKVVQLYSSDTLLQYIYTFETQIQLLSSSVKIECTKKHDHGKPILSRTASTYSILKFIGIYTKDTLIKTKICEVLRKYPKQQLGKLESPDSIIASINSSTPPQIGSALNLVHPKQAIEQAEKTFLLAVIDLIQDPAKTLELRLAAIRYSAKYLYYNNQYEWIKTLYKDLEFKIRNEFYNIKNNKNEIPDIKKEVNTVLGWSLSHLLAQ